MRFMLLIHHDEAAMSKLTKEDWATIGNDYAAWNQAMAKAGIGTPGERLQGSNAATTVRVKEGRPEVLDGPYADTREQFAGYCILDVADLDEAISWAQRCPSARNGSIEIRPMFVPAAW